MINPELRAVLPTLPGKDDIVTRLGLLFIEAFEEIVRMQNILEVSKEAHLEDTKINVIGLTSRYMQIIQQYLDGRQEYIDDLPLRFSEIVKEYQEMIFAWPEEQEGLQDAQEA